MKINRKKILAALTSLTMIAGAAASFPTATVTAENPIVQTSFTPDPAPVVDGEWLYVFAGHDAPDARGYTMRDWGVVRTKDMRTWEDLGLVMTPAVFKWATPDNRAWASQAIKRNGKWYWYVAVHGVRPRGDCIGVADREASRRPWCGLHRSVGIH